MNPSGLKECIDKLEVLSEIYNDIAKNSFLSKDEVQIAKLKLQLIKKEMLYLSYLINKLAQ